MKYRISTDEVIVNYIKLNLIPFVVMYAGTPLEKSGIVTSVNIKERYLVFQEEKGTKNKSSFDNISIPG